MPASFKKDILSIHNTRPEDNLLFICTRQDFSDVNKKTLIDICRNKNLRWDMLFSTAKLHGVAPIIYSNLKRCEDADLKIPSEIMQKFYETTIQNFLRKEKAAKKLRQILAFLNKKKIDTMLIKGAALDILTYNHSWATYSADIDLMLRKKREDLCEADISEIDSTLRPLWQIEMSFYTHHDIDYGGILPVNFDKIWSEAIAINYRGQKAFVMSPEDMLISLCINSCRKRFFKLKVLFDIAEFIRENNKINWDSVVSRSLEYQCNYIVFTALYVTKITLGCELPQNFLDRLKVNRIRARIISFLCQRMSFSSLSSLYSGINFFGNKINFSLILSYASLRANQIWRRSKNVSRRIMK